MHVQVLTLLALTIGAECMQRYQPPTTPQWLGGVNNADTEKYIDKVASLIPQIPDREFYWVPLKIISAKTQLVAGDSTTLEVLAARSSCKKDGPVKIGNVSLENCPVGENGEQATFTIKIYERSWANFAEINITKNKDDKTHKVTN